MPLILLPLNIIVIYSVVLHGLPFLSEKIYDEGGPARTALVKVSKAAGEAGIPGYIAVFGIALFAWDCMLKATNSESYEKFAQFEWLHILCGICFLAAIILAVFHSLRCMTEVGFIIFIGLPLLQKVIDFVCALTYGFVLCMIIVSLAAMAAIYLCPVLFVFFELGASGIGALINEIILILPAGMMLPFAILVLVLLLFGVPYLAAFIGAQFTSVENIGVSFAMLLILLILYGISTYADREKSAENGAAAGNRIRRINMPNPGLVAVIAFIVIGLVFSGGSTTPGARPLWEKIKLPKLPDLSKRTKTFKVPYKAVELNGHYYLVYDDATSWSDAQEKCEKMGGYLATITSQEEYDFIRSYLDKHDYNPVFFGCYSGGYIYEPVWYWVTGETFDYTAWGSGEPNADNGGKEFFGCINKGGWNDCLLTTGSSNQLYLCEWDSKKPEIQYSEYMEFNGHYYAVYDGALSWYDAEDKAREMGGYLVCITSEEENTEVRKLCRRNGALTVYFGIHTPNTYDTTNLQWVDGEPLEYTDWESDQPANLNGGEIGIIYSSGRWICEETYHTTCYVVEWDSESQIQE